VRAPHTTVPEARLAQTRHGYVPDVLPGPRPSSPLRAGAVRRVAVLRGGGLGDLVVALPALDALRTAYPRADIALLGTRGVAELLTGRPGPVDRVTALPVVRGVHEERGRGEEPGEVARFVDGVRGDGLDLALQMNGGGRFSNPFVRSLGATVTAGFRAPDAPGLDIDVPYRVLQHEVLRLLELTTAVGAPPVRLLPRLAVCARDRSEALSVLPERRPLAVVHPGAGDPRRCWPPARFAAVADALAAAGGTVVLTGTAQEGQTVDAVQGLMRHPSVSLVGALSLGGLAGVLAEAAVVVGNDTGPLHLARAVGTPTVAVYWGFNLPTWGPLLRTKDRAHAGWTSACPVCGAVLVRPELPGPDVARCPHEVSALADVAAGPVAADALELLGW
jgi:ADP-heptose:LPS heptosyltransferase